MARLVDIVTAVIERKWLDQIVSGRKKTEYRDIKPYWTKRLAKVQVPFKLRLINGMRPKAPEVTVEIVRVRQNGQTNQYELSIGRVVSRKNLD